MSKSLPVYELEQWIKSGNATGRIVARTLDGAFSSLREFDSHPAMPDMALRGAGYCVEWVKLEFGLSVDGAMPPIIGFTPLRLRWIGAKTMADPRYQPCENPVRVLVVPSKSVTPSNEMTREQFAEFEAVMAGPPSQPVLPLDIEAATEATMRAAVALGNRAADWLRAKGLTL